MSAVDVLRAARAKIADPSAWTKGVAARDALGEAIEPEDPSACCWCAIGALRAACDDVDVRIALKLALLNTIGFASYGLAEFNDRSTHASVIGAFDITIARLDAGATS